MKRPPIRIASLAVVILVCSACGSDATGSSKGTTYKAAYAANVVETIVSTSLTGGGSSTCTYTYAMTGILTITLDNTTGPASGSAQVTGTQAAKGRSPDTCAAKSDLTTSWSPPLTGTASDLHFDDSRVSTNAGFSLATTTSFAGAVTGGAVAGVFTFTETGSGSPNGVTNVTQSYSASAQLVLTQ